MINTRHRLYNDNLDLWEKVRDACEGEDTIKLKSEKYLPKPSGMESGTYNNYLARAKYVNYSGKVLSNAIAQIFRLNPVITDFDEVIQEDIDLQGRSLPSFSRQLLNEIMLTNRAGVLIDWSDEQSRPYLSMFKAENIINWRLEKNKPVLIVLEGTIEKPDPVNPYLVNLEKMWKELYIEEGIYKVRDWQEFRDTQTNTMNAVIVAEYEPMINDKHFDFIPFFCITTLGDTLEVLKSPLLDLANLNLGAYINSADYENMLHWSSARTIITNQLGDTDFHIGGVVDFPIGGGASYLETKSDALILEELRHKEEQMAVLGSSLLSGKGRYVASAQTAEINSDGEHASLSDVSTSLSEVMTYVLRIVMQWLRNDSTETSIEYNTVFKQTGFQPNELTTYIQAVAQGVLSFDAFYSIMESREIYPADWTLEMEKALLETKEKEKIEAFKSSLENFENEDEENEDEGGEDERV